jgi:transposase InsO family protein
VKFQQVVVHLTENVEADCVEQSVFYGGQMDYHHHARLTVHGREVLCRAVSEGRLGLCEAAAEHGLSRQSASKWVRRFREHGLEGLVDRSSRPQRMRQPTTAEQIAQVEALRRERWTGQRIAQQTGLSRATVSRLLGRAKLSRIRDLDPKPPTRRYEHPHPGDLLHLDIKRLVKIARPSHRVTGNRRDTVKGIGCEYVHVAIDDHSRIAFSAIYPDETRASVLDFLSKALTYYARLGIHFKAVLTDNGTSYRSYAFADRCRELGLKHRRTRPYTPRTNGKAERFIQTALREWAYARTYQTSDDRENNLQPWIHQYNWHRPHASLGLSPPISRSRLDVNNLLRLHS